MVGLEPTRSPRSCSLDTTCCWGHCPSLPQPGPTVRDCERQISQYFGSAEAGKKSQHQPRHLAEGEGDPKRERVQLLKPSQKMRRGPPTFSLASSHLLSNDCVLGTKETTGIGQGPLPSPRTSQCPGGHGKGKEYMPHDRAQVVTETGQNHPL